MRYPLLIAGAALVLIGLYDLLYPVDHDHDHDHDHGHVGSRVGWLLLLPLLVLFGVSPSALGADGANRFAAYDPAPSDDRPDPLPPTGTVNLTLHEFRNYALSTNELRGRTITLTGFVVNDTARAADGFVLTRFIIGCCAADAFRIEVGIRGVPQAWNDGAWVRVTGTWIEPTGTLATPGGVEIQIQAIEVVGVPEPKVPYESLW